MEKTYFTVNMEFSTLDEKLRRFIELRNELVILASEIGIEAKGGLLLLEKK